jgi:DNA-binding transcriptional MerR regulator
MRIGELVQRTGVPAKTIRYYEAIGVLPIPPRLANGYRDYDDTVVERLAFVRAAQASGLRLGEIRSVIAFRDRGETPCDHVRALIDRRAVEIDRRLDELTRLRRELERLSRRARHLDPADCTPSGVCHIIMSTG